MDDTIQQLINKITLLGRHYSIALDTNNGITLHGIVMQALFKLMSNIVKALTIISNQQVGKLLAKKYTWNKNQIQSIFCRDELSSKNIFS